MTFEFEPFDGPLALDKGSLYLWVQYKLEESQPVSITFDYLNRFDEYRRLGENQTLLCRLNKLLEVDQAVDCHRDALKLTIDRMFSPRFYLKRRAIKRQLEMLLEERKKAYDAYEMLRKLSFANAEGNVFKIYLT